MSQSPVEIRTHREGEKRKTLQYASVSRVPEGVLHFYVS
jgi:hypothetical protein